MHFSAPVYFVLSVFLGLIGHPDTTSAGDFADVELHGFSVEGRHFAFEQFGIEDGSGFPYSEIFVINVESDKWVKPSPFRLKNENPDEFATEEELIAELRAEHHDKVREFMNSKRIAGRGRTVGRNPITELNANPHLMIVNPRQVVPPADDPMILKLNEYPIISPTCAQYGAATQGFQLVFQYQGKTRILHKDSNLPKSRGCPLRYRIERVITDDPVGLPPDYAVFAVLILMETHGFEGPDGRYLAITGQF